MLERHDQRPDDRRRAEQHDDRHARGDERPSGCLSPIPALASARPAAAERPPGRRCDPAAAAGARGARAAKSEPEPPARIWLTCCAARPARPAAADLPSSTDTIMLPMTGGDLRVARELRPGLLDVAEVGDERVDARQRLVHLLRRSRASSATDCADRQIAGCQREIVDLRRVPSSRAGTSPPPLTRAAPLLKITQLSGPEMV